MLVFYGRAAESLSHISRLDLSDSRLQPRATVLPFPVPLRAACCREPPLLGAALPQPVLPALLALSLPFPSPCGAQASPAFPELLFPAFGNHPHSSAVQTPAPRRAGRAEVCRLEPRLCLAAPVWAKRRASAWLRDPLLGPADRTALRAAVHPARGTWPPAAPSLSSVFQPEGWRCQPVPSEERKANRHRAPRTRLAAAKVAGAVIFIFIPHHQHAALARGNGAAPGCAFLEDTGAQDGSRGDCFLRRR